MSNKPDLLASLRSISSKQAASAPKPRAAANAAAVTAQADYAKMTDFKTLSDYTSLRAMKLGFGENGMFNNIYFQARTNEALAVMETDKGPKITFSGYNYLGLGSDARVKQAVIEATEQYGTHAGAARMVGGEITLHKELEKNIADFVGTDDCVVGVGGYSTNVALIAYLLGKDDLLIHDSYMHNSGVKGAQLSEAKRLSFAHNDLGALEELLIAHRSRSQRAMILVEGAYSMDGDIIDMHKLIELKKKYGCWLMVDEAHSIGTLGATGRGISEHCGTDVKEIDIIMGTLSKSLGSCGGFICGSQDMCDLIAHYAPGLLLYSTGISPANTAAAHEALNVLRQEPERVTRLIDNSKFFADYAREVGLDIGDAIGQTPVVPVMIGEDLKAIDIASNLFDDGYLLHPIMYPVVPKDTARIRFFITSLHTREQIKNVIDKLASYLEV